MARRPSIIALLTFALVLSGCEIVGGIKRRPLASGGSGGMAGTGAGTGGTAGSGGPGGLTGGAGSAAIGQVNAPCSTPLADACEGANSLQKLECDGQFWRGSGKCPADQRCDTRPGPTTGACVAVVPECRGTSPGDHVCVGNEIRSCGPDLITTTLVIACSDPASPDCNAGACSCGGNMCGAICAHLDVDRDHCGSCDRRCQGGCSAGTCQPIVVASGQGSSPGLVVDNGVIYWTNSDQGIVAKADVNGGASTMIAANQGVMVGLAIGGSNLYWTSVEMAAVMKVAVGGGDVTPVAGGQSFSTNGANGQIAVRDGKVFWITDGGAVRSASVEGGATATLATLSVCRGLAVNTTNVFASCMSWGLSKLAWDGSGRTTLVGGYYGPFAIDSASIYHYWTPGLRRIDLDGGSPTVLTSTSASGPLTVDAADVYFTNGGTLMKIGIGGGSPSTVVAASGTSTAIVAVTVDDTRIYWRTMGGDVLKVEK